MQDSALPLLIVLNNTEGPSVSSAQVLNIAPGEGQISVSFAIEPNWEAFGGVALYCHPGYSFLLFHQR